MAEQRQPFYRLAPGIDVVPLGEEAILFRSDTLTARIEGASVAVLRDRVLPLLDGSSSLAQVARQLPGLDLDDVRRRLDGLAEAGILEQADHAMPPTGRSRPLLAFLQAAGLPATQARERLAGLRVAVFGLEGPGAYAAAALAACGIGQLVLVDPYPCQQGNLALMPPLHLEAVGQPREQALQRALEAQGVDTRVELGAMDPVDAAGVDALTGTCQLVIGAFDKGLSAVNQWLNRASLKHGVSALYARLAAHVGVVGPLVIPDRSACYLCWRMRAIACADSYSEVMAHERFLAGQRRPALHDRPALPTLAPFVGGLVATEAMKLLLSIGSETLAGRVHEFDALQLRDQTHAVLRVPGCPACGRPARRPAQPSLEELVDPVSPPGDVLRAARSLVSPSCGVVTALEPLPKDPSEPERPYLYSARLANHRFVQDPQSDDGICSGKGLTPSEARATALGEAVERYSAACLPADEVRYATRPELGATSLDPIDLVLYLPEQYERLPYAPYSDATTLGWVSTRSLVTGSSVLVPALAVGMSYSPRTLQEYLCSTTSNGLAAGPTLADAILSALYEVLERDAFLITWLNRLPARRVAPETHPDPAVVGIHHAHARRGVELRLYRLATDQPCPVFLCVAMQRDGGDGPAAVAGLGADLDPARAASKAIFEAGQVRPGLRIQLRQPGSRARMERLNADPREVRTMDDHALLYAHPSWTEAFAFLDGGPQATGEWSPSPEASTADRLRFLAGRFREQGDDILYRNLTSADMAQLGLHTARVIVPGFQPIHFGWDEARLGGRRLYEVPHWLGFTAAPTSPQELNADPHPLA
jgi:bacteriocin biosynthesis cyclodehydratase domain-containing protein